MYAWRPASTDPPAEQHIARGLEQALPGDDPLAVGREGAGTREALEYRGLRLLGLHEQRVVVRATLKERDVGTQADAADAHHLERGVHDLVAVKQDAPVALEVLAVAGQCDGKTLWTHLGRVRDDRRVVGDPPPDRR